METAPQLGGFFHAQVGVADCEAAVIVDSTRAAGSGIRAYWQRDGHFTTFSRSGASSITGVASSITFSVIGELIARVIDYARTPGHTDRRAGHTGPTRRTGAACARCAAFRGRE
jgi:hypothetical protein